jgi:hypothetical protein
MIRTPLAEKPKGFFGTKEKIVWRNMKTVHDFKEP